jgi:hypothetical protein
MATSAAEPKVAQINDPDGFTNIRKGPSKDTEITGKILKNDFFYCEVSYTSDWYKVTAQQWDGFGRQTSGYMHKSRIRIIEDTPLDEQKQIIEKVLLRHKELSDSTHPFLKKKRQSKKDSIEYKKLISESMDEVDKRFDPILEVLPKYFCKSKDSTIINLFFDTIWADKGSANESPSLSLGECFVCDSELILYLIKQIHHKDKRNFIIDDVEFGLDESTIPVYIKFERKLERLR